MTSEDSDLISAMLSGDLLKEAELRYEIVAKALDPGKTFAEGERAPTGTEIKALSIEADTLMRKIVALRAEKVAAARKTGAAPDQAAEQAKFGQVVQFDASRYRKQG